MITNEAVQYLRAASASAPKSSLAQVDELIKAAEALPHQVTKGDAQALMAEVVGTETLSGVKIVAAVRERLLQWAQNYSATQPTLGRPDLSPLAMQVAIMVRGLSSEERQPYRDLLGEMMQRGLQVNDLMTLVLKHNLPNLVDWKPETAAQALEVLRQMPAAEAEPVNSFPGVQRGACRRCGVHVGEEDFCEACAKASDDEPPFMEGLEPPAEVEPPSAEELAAVAASQEFNPETLLGKPWRHRDGAAAKVIGIQGFGEAAVIEVDMVDDPTMPPQQWAVHRFLEEFMPDVAHPGQLTLVPPVQEEPPCPTAPDATTEPTSSSSAEATATSETGSSSSQEPPTSTPKAEDQAEPTVSSDIDPVPPPLSPAPSAAPAPTPLTFPSADRLADLRRKEAELTTLIGQAQQELDQVRAEIADEERLGEKRRKREELARQLAELDRELGEAS